MSKKVKKNGLFSRLIQSLTDLSKQEVDDEIKEIDDLSSKERDDAYKFKECLKKVKEKTTKVETTARLKTSSSHEGRKKTIKRDLNLERE